MLSTFQNDLNLFLTKKKVKEKYLSEQTSKNSRENILWNIQFFLGRKGPR